MAEESTGFATLLRRLRVAAGLTQEELAERAQLSERAIRRLEHDGERTPRLQTVQLLAHALGLPPDEQFRLLAAARPAELGSSTAARSSLPHVHAPLIGREDDLAIVKMLLEDRSLVTLTGPGGVGKTRLALATAEQMPSQIDRVSFVGLAPLRDADNVLSAIAAACSVRDDGMHSLFNQVCGELRTGAQLLVLDNMEHLLGARSLVMDLLDACLQLTVLITSREPLRVRGERVYMLGPLLLPERDADILRSPAVRLFLDRAQEAGATVVDDEATILALAQICRRLDGLPLAIELAAAWTPWLPPPALLQQLGPRLIRLDRGPRDLPPRQRTMRDAIAWSYDLLDPPERALFRRLSVFAGGWTLDAVEAVCGDDLDVLSVLTALLDKSLVTVEGTSGGEAHPRFRMLETVREFAHDQLEASIDSEVVYCSHASYFLRLATEGRRELEGPDQALWLDRLERERDNFRAALRTAEQTNDVDLGLRLAGALWLFWQTRGHWQEAQKWLATFLGSPAAANVDPGARADALFAAGALAFDLQGNQAALTLVRQGLALAEQTGDDRSRGVALYSLAGGATARGDYPEAERMLVESLDILRRVGDRRGMAVALQQLASVARCQGSFEQALARYHESLALSRAMGDARRVAEGLARLGQLLADQGRTSEALALYAEALSFYRHLRDTQGIADALYRTGSAASDVEEYARATACFEESLALYRSLGNKYGAAYVLLNHAESAVRMRRFEEAEALAEESLALFTQLEDRRCIALVLVTLADVAHGEYDDVRALALCKEALALSVELNIRPGIVVCLERLARLAWAHNREERAARLHGAARGMRESMQAAMPPADRIPYDRDIDAMRTRMGDARFDAAETEGRTMVLREITAFALGEHP
jgi:predicted ATPase/DNA-binding XRE family transcriptional regulator